MMNNAIFSELITLITTMDDVQGAKLLAVANGLLSEKTTPVKATPVSKKSNDFIPEGTPDEVVGKIARFGKGISLNTQGFIPNKVRFAIKSSLKDAGAKWDEYTKCFEFSSKKACNEWLKSQKSRVTA